MAECKRFKRQEAICDMEFRHSRCHFKMIRSRINMFKNIHSSWCFATIYRNMRHIRFHLCISYLITSNQVNRRYHKAYFVYIFSNTYTLYDLAINMNHFNTDMVSFLLWGLHGRDLINIKQRWYLLSPLFIVFLTKIPAKPWRRWCSLVWEAVLSSLVLSISVMRVT